MKVFSLLYKHAKTFGWEGIFFLFQRVLYRNRIICIKVNGGQQVIYLRNNTSDIPVFYQVFLSKSYNVNYGPEPKVIVDCGANIGLASIFYSIKFPNAQIYAVEPEDSNFDLMVRNTENYQNIKCIKGGIWYEQTNLSLVNNQDEKWRFEVQKKAGEGFIPGITIPSLMQKFNISRIDIMKIDIEGSERELFSSNFEWLSDTNVVIIELHDGLRSGASKAFFKAINHFDYSMIKKKENLIFYMK